MTATVGGAVSLSWSDVPTEGGPITLSVTRPDGGTSSPAVTLSGTTASATIVPDHPGRHVLAWAQGDERHADIVDVWPEEPHYLISIDDALDAIRAKFDKVRDLARDEIQLYVAAASYVVENITGPIISAERTRRIRYNGRSLLLPAPGQVTSVSVLGSTQPLAESAYEVDEEAGIVWVEASAGTQLVVTHTVGGAVIAPNVRLATREEVRFLWQVGHQGARGQSPAAETTPFTSEGFAVPRRVTELLQGVSRIAGIA